MLELITPPALEPVSLSEAKTHLRVDGSAEDTLITALIQSARQHVEGATSRSLMPTTWRESFAEFSTMLTLTMAPLVSIVSVKAYDSAGTLGTMSPGLYLPMAPGGPLASRGWVELADGSSWPDTPTRSNAVQVEYLAGYADAAAVPGPLKSALLLTLTDLFENRAGGIEQRMIGANPAVDALLAPYRITWV
jgi:uncharacterized phiE125 gp8 family phage protein